MKEVYNTQRKSKKKKKKKKKKYFKNKKKKKIKIIKKKLKYNVHIIFFLKKMLFVFVSLWLKSESLSTFSLKVTPKFVR